MKHIRTTLGACAAADIYYCRSGTRPYQQLLYLKRTADR